MNFDMSKTNGNYNGRRRRNIQIAPPPAKKVLTDEDFVGVEFDEETNVDMLYQSIREAQEADFYENSADYETSEYDNNEELELTPEEQLEADFPYIENEDGYIILNTETYDEDEDDTDSADAENDGDDFEGLEDEMEEMVDYVALHETDDLISDSIFAEIDSADTTEEGDEFWEDDDTENDGCSAEVDFTALFPDVDTMEGMFYTEDYLQPMAFEVDADPDDPAFQAELFNFYGIKEDKDELILNCNVFANALTKKILAKKYGKALFFYNHQHGIYESVTTADFQTIAKDVLDAISLDIWDIYYEKKYTSAFKHAINKQNVVPCNARYVAFNNGTLDLAKMKFLPHSPEPVITNYFAYDYDPATPCPLWEQTLDIIFHGEKEVIESFREMFGSFLLHGEGFAVDKLFILLGRGANGKSLCTKVIKHVLTAKNCSAQSFAQISSKFGLAPIYDRFINISNENEQIVKDSSIFKALTSGDDMSIEFKYRDPFRAVPYVKLICATNQMPSFCGHSDGMIRRLHIFNFDVRFVDKNKERPLAPNEYPVDRQLLKKLKAERAGILNWALVGTQRLLKNKLEFTMPESIRKHNNRFALEANPVKYFLDSCVSKKEGNRVESPDVFIYYKKWAQKYQIQNTHFNTNQVFHAEFKSLLRTFLEYNPDEKLTLQAHGRDRYRDIKIDTSLPLVMPEFF